ncbi:MAG: M28 family metallopeptidase [Proteobacteria bacterium]|nr:M28 family metallopeptidase [Pseudomonadota bacterium]
MTEERLRPQPPASSRPRRQLLRWAPAALGSVAWLAAAAAPSTADIPAAIQPAQLRATVETLVGFGTRHTLSETQSDARGIGAARRWAQKRFDEIGRACGGCLDVRMVGRTVSGPRVPQPTEVVDVVAVQRGTVEPERVVVITGHIDSRVTDVMNAQSDAPGANDDASGVAAVLEAARVLSTQRFRATIVYGVLSGEEQGLYGGKILADYAKEQGWQVEADLNNDIVGNTHGGDGVNDNTTVRVFSEGTKATETAQQANRRRYNGGELDSPSRNLARYLAALAERSLTNLRVEMVYRTDRYNRGGDQVEFLNAGFPALRLSEAHEDYTRQHQDVRVERGIRYGDTIDGVDFDYLAQVTRLDALALASLANAPAPPRGVTIAGAVTPDTVVKWQPAAGATGYRVWWRATTDPQWRYSRNAPGDATELRLADVSIDDWFFGVSAIAADGSESPVVFPGDAGSF